MMLWYISALARLIVGLALLCGGVTKSLNFSWFAATLGKYELVPKRHIKKAGLTVATVELAVGTGLIAGLALPWTAYAGVAVLTVFTLAICISLRRGKFKIGCGCGSPKSKATLGWHAITRNFGLIALSCLAGIPNTERFRFVSVLLFSSAIGLLAIAGWYRGSSHEGRTQIQSSPTIAH